MALFKSCLSRTAATRAQASAFEDGVRDFWNGFRKNAPFAFTGPVDEAYGQLDRYYAQLIKVGA